MTRKTNTILVILLLFMMVAAAAFGGFMFDQLSNKHSNTDATTTDAIRKTATYSDATELNATELDATITDTIVIEATPLEATISDATPVDATADEIEIEPIEEYVVEEISEEPTTEEITTEEVITEYIYPTDDEFMMMCAVVEAEVHGGDTESKIHVAHVIRNRVGDPLFPDNIIAVCTSPNQFANRWDIEQSTIDAVSAAMEMEDTTYGAVSFHSMGYMDTFFGRPLIFMDNVGHCFY